MPPAYNALERAIRNVKVKQKISGQFVIIHSVIDTALKNGANLPAGHAGVFNALKLIANLTPE